jgi:predicted ATPase/DNA-binding CsgD family transcriptional regulator
LAVALGGSEPGVDGNTVSRWEREVISPTPRYVRLLAKLFESSPEALGLIPETAPTAVASDGTSTAEPIATRTSSPAQSTRARLPAHLTSFVGRAAELEALANLVRSSRLVTITGAAGMGKTRLVIEVAVRIEGDAVASAVHYIGLAALVDEGLVVQEIASSLGVPERAGERLEDTLVASIGDRSMLLVLDNCELFVAACARLVEALLSGCANLHVLATSLQSLRVPGEVVWRIAPLSLPGRRSNTTGQPLADSEAARLFEDRARLVQPDFEIEPANASAVAHVCRRLDGIPLAIELAAALLETMSVQDVLSRLDDRFGLLAGEARGGVARHRTLHAAMDWGHQVLDDQERRVFRRIAVFAGGFELSSCEAVCAGDGVKAEEVGGLVLRLVERSLVRLELNRRGPARYRLLEPIRHYAAERLVESGERAAVAERHAIHFLTMAERAEHEEWGEDRPGWLERLETELDNLRLALAWFRACNASRGLRMASALSWFWVTRGHYIEGRAWLEGALAGAPEDTLERARALLAVARVSFWQGDYAAARCFCDEGLARFERDGDAMRCGWTLILLGSILAYQGEYGESRRRFREALAVTDHEHVQMEALVGLVEMLLLAGDLPEARDRLEEVVRLVRGPDAPRGRAALFLGIVAVLDGERETARTQLAWALELFRWLGNAYAAAAALDALAALAVANADPIRALQLCGAADGLRASTRSQLAPRWQELRSATVLEPATAAAGERTAAALAEGERMTFDEAISYARTEQPPATARPEQRPEMAALPPPAGLTPRELEIAELVARGLTNRQIAERLVIAERTVESHVERIRVKLGVHSRRQVGAGILRERAWPAG